MKVPLVDLERLAEDDHERDELKRGLTDVGFFLVKNWGCSESFIKKVEKLTRDIMYAPKDEQAKDVKLQKKIRKFFK